MNKVITNLGLASVLLMGLGACTESAPDPSNADVATQWLEAGQTSQEASIANIEANMADDGVMYRDRYVGFGFTFDNTDESDQMIVETVIDGSPASAVLAVGDEFMSVRGVAVTAENRDSGQLSFRGTPGEVVDAVIKRGDEMINIAVARGKIESTLSKAEMLDWMASGDGDDWGAEAFTLHEVVASGNVAYAWTTVANTDDISGQMVETHVVTRFVFNESGQVAGVGNIREDRFILEQQGYSITR